MPPRTQAVDEVFDLLGIGFAGSVLLKGKWALLKQERGVNMHGCSKHSEDGGVGKHEDGFRGRHPCF